MKNSRRTQLLLSCFFITCNFFLSFSTYGQKRISFLHDSAGNQIERVICVDCDAKTVKDSVKSVETVTKEDLIKDSLHDDISYYPNPVKEELYVKWTKEKGNNVIAIEVYSMTGQLMKKSTGLQNVDIANIEFQSYPQGFYNVVLNFDNGEKKTLKIIKQ